MSLAGSLSHMYRLSVKRLLIDSQNFFYYYDEYKIGEQ